MTVFEARENHHETMARTNNLLLDEPNALADEKFEAIHKFSLIIDANRFSRLNYSIFL